MSNIGQPVLKKNKVFKDERGIFVPLEWGSARWSQSNISINPKKFTLRGLHFQEYPFQQSKLVKVINGSIIDFITNLDVESESYLKIKTFTMKPGDELYVPKNYAHGFITLEKDTIVQYLVDDIYHPESEGVIPWTEFNELKEEFKKISNFSVENILIKDRDLVFQNFKK